MHDDLYQAVILDHHRSPRNRHALDGPARSAEGHNPLCGDRVRVWLRVADGVVTEASFEGDGCAISQASASLLTQAVTGRPVAEVRALFERVHGVVTGQAEAAGAELGKLAVLGGVAKYPMRVKCATLAWHAMLQALDAPEAPAPMPGPGY